MHQLRYILYIFPLLFLIPIITDQLLLCYYVIGITLLHTICFLRIAFSSKNHLFSPVSVFVSMHNLYFVLGVTMWVIRELYFDNWDGNLFLVIIIFAITSYALSLWGYFELNNRDVKEPYLALNQMSLPLIMFLFLLLLEYLGIYLFTSGFSVIPILEPDIDEARQELGATKSSGTGIGAILIYCGVLCVYHSVCCKLNKLIKFILFVISYIPFLLYGGRLLMVLPLLVLPIVYMVKKDTKLNKKIILSSVLTIASVFCLLMLYGTQRGKGEVDAELFVNFLTADLFPEFRGAVAAFQLNHRDLGPDYTSMILSRFFPGSIAPIIGIDKEHQLSPGGYVADLLGYNGIGIRISLTGELLLSSVWFYILFWFIVIYILHTINKSYFSSNVWGKDKLIYMYIGLFISLVIPYGTGLIANTIILLVVMLILKKICYPTTKRKHIANKIA